MTHKSQKLTYKKKSIGLLPLFVISSMDRTSFFCNIPSNLLMYTRRWELDLEYLSLPVAAMTMINPPYQHHAQILPETYFIEIA